MKEGVGMGTPGRVLDGRDLGPGGAGRAGEPRRQRSAGPPLRAAWETASSSAGMRVWWLPYQHTSQHTPSSSEGKGKMGGGGVILLRSKLVTRRLHEGTEPQIL